MATGVADTLDIEINEDESYFFSRLGEICLHAESGDEGDNEYQRGPGALRSVAVASRHDLTAFSDGRGALLATACLDMRTWYLHLETSNLCASELIGPCITLANLCSTRSALQASTLPKPAS